MSNCTADRKTVGFTYYIPFQMLAEREPETDGGPGGNRTPIYRMQTGCSTTKLQALVVRTDYEARHATSGTSLAKKPSSVKRAALCAPRIISPRDVP